MPLTAAVPAQLLSLQEENPIEGEGKGRGTVVIGGSLFCPVSTSFPADRIWEMTLSCMGTELVFHLR